MMPHETPNAADGALPMQTPDHPKEYLEGFTDFAAYIASDSDLEIYRRFKKLAARNLLYLQSELLSLESRLEDLDREDQARLATATVDEKMDIQQRNRDWDTFARYARPVEGQYAGSNDTVQAQKMRCAVELRRLLGEYQDALIRQSKCLALSNPGKGQLGAFKKWYFEKTPLLDIGGRLLDDSRDLLCLREEVNPDRLSRLMRHNFAYFFQEARGYPDSWGKLYYYREETVARIITVTGVLLAACLLVGSIVALYFERRPGVRLGFLGIFTLVFAASVGLLTNAKRAEVFQATAAYAAVLVVFVSGNFGAIPSTN